VFRSETKSCLKLNYPAGKSAARLTELLIAYWVETVAASDKRPVIEKAEAGKIQIIENVKEIKSKIKTRGLAQSGYSEAL